jgi:Asp-tRNA(Asn)/Glu-tRNA(Gln) amidotransferase C subunit
MARLDAGREPSGAGGPGLVRDLGVLLEYLRALDPPGADGAPSPADPGRAARLRPDEPRPSLDRERVLAAAPERLGNLFGVPRVLG